MLIVQPWDKGLMRRSTRRSAIRAGPQPGQRRQHLRVPVPALNEERRREMVRLLHKLGEEGRVAIRHARQEANKEIKRSESAHEIGEDDARRQMDEIQKLTDDYIGQVDALLKAKEQEVMEV
jgi:ribosome recycling factor